MYKVLPLEVECKCENYMNTELLSLQYPSSWEVGYEGVWKLWKYRLVHVLKGNQYCILHYHPTPQFQAVSIHNALKNEKSLYLVVIVRDELVVNVGYIAFLTPAEYS